MLQPLSLQDLNNAFGHWLVFSGSRLMLAKGELTLSAKRWHDIPSVQHYADRVFQMATPQREHPCFVVDLGAEQPDSEHVELVSLRQVLMHSTAEDFEYYARAWQYVHFMRTHRYCGQCGNNMARVDWEVATQCTACGHRCYPRVSPCIIVAVYHGNQILLAQGERHKDTGIYSTLAGFVESGESLEQAVHREIMEEVGVRVGNLSYFGSQAWPFPHSLMVGYLAEYQGGEIKVDGVEIHHAAWFDINELPQVPPKISIAGQLIEAVRARSQ